MELGLPEIVVVLVVVLLLFGPSKVPQLGESLGRAIRGFRDAVDGRAERSEQPRPAQGPGTPPALPAAQGPGQTGEPLPERGARAS